jgi:hypothetical protein
MLVCHHRIACGDIRGKDIKVIETGEASTTRQDSDIGDHDAEEWEYDFDVVDPSRESSFITQICDDVPLDSDNCPHQVHGKKADAPEQKGGCGWL